MWHANQDYYALTDVYMEIFTQVTFSDPWMSMQNAKDFVGHINFAISYLYDIWELKTVGQLMRTKQRIANFRDFENPNFASFAKSRKTRIQICEI